MDNLPFLLLFWYGVLHAFGPDHLTAIADFSIGKSKKKTLLITLAFALGHGLSLFLFAKLLQHLNLNPQILRWGDIISASVIVVIGLFLLYMAWSNKINVGVHEHNGEKHIHIWFGKEHSHSERELKSRLASALTIGALMGIGGVRGMLITLSAVAHNRVDLKMVVSFTLGVIVVFLAFGLFMAYLNENILKTKRNVKLAFTTAGIISLLVGSSMLL